MNNIACLNNLEALEKVMLSRPQAPCNVTHKFGPGLYMRELFIPKDTLIMGHHQNFEHMNIFVKGKMTFFRDDGEKVFLEAPMTFVGKPGQKVAYAHEDCIWTNVYATSETDIETLESYYLTKSETSKKDTQEKFGKLLLTSSEDKEDYQRFLDEFHLKEEDVRHISEITFDQIKAPFGSYKVKTGKSKIDGTGLIATSDIKGGETIMPARINGKRTIAGRYTNHSKNPNAKMIKRTIYEGYFVQDIELVALKDIKGCMGGRDGDEITVNYRDALKLNMELGAREWVLLLQQ